MSSPFPSCLMVCAIVLASGCALPSPKVVTLTSQDTTCGDGVCVAARELALCPEDCVEQWMPKMDFVTVWEVFDEKKLTIPAGDGEFLYQVDWDNDGVFDQKNLTGPASHEYPKPGVYTVRIRGIFPHMCSTLEKTCPSYEPPLKQYTFHEQPSPAQYLLEVQQWGNIQWRSMSRMFVKQIKLFALPTRPPVLSHTQDMSHMFSGAKAFNQSIDTWNTTTITDMSHMFFAAHAFNQALGNWDTSHVTNMDWMFHNAEAFNQPIGTWSTSNVTTMQGMFSNAYVFNQPLDAWDTSHVTNMRWMFSGAKAFDQFIDTWNTANVIDMNWMFSNAYVFNQPIGAWDTSHVTNMEGMFSDAKAFDQPLGQWDTSHVTNMGFMFSTAYAFNHPLGAWDTSHVTDMTAMFYKTEAFNQDISTWDTSNVTTMMLMFNGAKKFNKPLGAWNISKVKQSVDSITEKPSDGLIKIFPESSMTVATYDATLQGWAANKATPKDLTLTTDLHYCKSAKARKKLTKTLGWTISDKGKRCS